MPLKAIGWQDLDQMAKKSTIMDTTCTKYK